MALINKETGRYLKVTKSKDDRNNLIATLTEYETKKDRDLEKKHSTFRETLMLYIEEELEKKEKELFKKIGGDISNIKTEKDLKEYMKNIPSLNKLYEQKTLLFNEYSLLKDYFLNKGVIPETPTVLELVKKNTEKFSINTKKQLSSSISTCSPRTVVMSIMIPSGKDMTIEEIYDYLKEAGTCVNNKDDI